MAKGNVNVKPADEKAEFLMEVAERYNYWLGKKCPEYAALYERMLLIVTTPAAAQKDKP